MGIRPFLLERFFAEHEFSTRYLLSSSDCDGWPMAEVLALADAQARGLWERLSLGYTQSPGLPLLRSEIARQYRGVDSQDVLIAAPQELIHLAMHALLRAGDHVICTHPGYQSLYEIAADIGCELEHWRPIEAEGWRFDVERLARMIRPDTKLVVVNFPHNPTGALPPLEDFRRVVELVAARGARLFSDEMYRLLEADVRDRLPSACELSERALTLSGMSKAFGLAGIRIGWLVVKDRALRERIAELRDYTTICNAAPSEVLALIGLRAQETILARHRARIAHNMSLLDDFFSRQSASFTWVRPKAGTVGFPAFLRPEPPAEFCARLVREAGVLLLPSTVYDYEPPHLRFGFGREDLPEALNRLEEFLSAGA